MEGAPTCSGTMYVAKPISSGRTQKKSSDIRARLYVWNSWLSVPNVRMSMLSRSVRSSWYSSVSTMDSTPPMRPSSTYMRPRAL